ncbi:cysteine-rich CWC family protein [Shewanella sp.]|uniref:cysteine-rich CWC family protein n=1 Tax=Shewanella sp. TaxID=50422 RepID=UPI003561C004
MSEKSQCPLCERANLCAFETGKSIEDCWCHYAHFPKKLPERPDACLCADCVARLAKAERLALKLTE